MAFDFGIDASASPESEGDRNALCLPIPLIDLPLNVGPRRWIYGTSLVRGMLSVLGGTGGVGKSRYAIKVGLSIALGRGLLAATKDEKEHRIYQPGGGVWYISLEDPVEELQRCLLAEIKSGSFNPRDMWDHFYISSARDTPLIVAQSEGRSIVRCPMDSVVKNIKSYNIDLLIVDPFANSFHGELGTESGSDAMKIILDQWRQVAHQADCAVWLIHHFRKGGLGGDADAFRGSSVIQNAARVMETLTTMTPQDAELLGIDPGERRQYVRLENAKVNLSAAPSEAQWFRFSSVDLKNGTADYPDGDAVGILTRWKPLAAATNWSDTDATLNAIDAGDSGEYYSSAPQASRWGGYVVMTHMGMTDKQAAATLKDWLKKGVLVKDSYTSPATRHAAERLLVNPDAKMRLKEQRHGS